MQENFAHSINKEFHIRGKGKKLDLVLTGPDSSSLEAKVSIIQENYRQEYVLHPDNPETLLCEGLLIGAKGSVGGFNIYLIYNHKYNLTINRTYNPETIKSIPFK